MNSLLLHRCYRSVTRCTPKDAGGMVLYQLWRNTLDNRPTESQIMVDKLNFSAVVALVSHYIIFDGSYDWLYAPTLFVSFRSINCIAIKWCGFQSIKLIINEWLNFGRISKTSKFTASTSRIRLSGICVFWKFHLISLQSKPVATTTDVLTIDSNFYRDRNISGRI